MPARDVCRTPHAQALAEYTRTACAGMHQQGMLYPPLSTIVKATTHIAAAVAEVAFAQGLASVPRPDGSLVQHLTSVRYQPSYDAGTPGRGDVPSDEPGGEQ